MDLPDDVEASDSWSDSEEDPSEAGEAESAVRGAEVRMGGASQQVVGEVEVVPWGPRKLYSVKGEVARWQPELAKPELRRRR